jgi:hypothetical protein
VNQVVLDPATGKNVRVNDLTAGKYDVVVTTGPSFSTRREEAAALWAEMAGQFPAIIGVAGDLIAKSTDLPYSDEIAKRLQMLLPPEIQQQIAEGKDIPPEAMAVLAQAKQMSEMVAQQGQFVQQAAGEADQKKAEAEKAVSAVEKAIANLKTEEARFEAKVAKIESQFIQREANLAMQTDDLSIQKQQMDGERRELEGTKKQTDTEASELSAAKGVVQQIDQALSQFVDAQSGILEEMRAEMLKPKPKLKSATTKRGPKGELAIEAMMDDGSLRRMMAQRGPDGNLTAQAVEDQP